MSRLCHFLEWLATVVILSLVVGLLCLPIRAATLRYQVQRTDEPAVQDRLSVSVSQAQSASAVLAQSSESTMLMPQLAVDPLVSSASTAYSQVVFSDGLEALVSIWGATQITAVVPVGVVSGPVVIETERGTSSGVLFEVGSWSVPDNSGEGTSWSTQVSGTISTDTTWSSNVRVTGDVEVAAGATLTIQPGVTVFFAAGSDAQSTGVWPAMSELLVYGTLIAGGTQADPIYFTSDAGAPAAGDWGGIVIRRGSTDSSISHSVIRYAFNGVRFHSYNEGTTTIAGTVSNCTISDNIEGIHLDGEPSYSTGGTVTIQPLISGNLIRDNTEIGIFVRTCTGYGTAINNGVVRDNRIEGNGIGIRSTACSWWQGHADDLVEIQNNSIRSNSTYGLDIRSGGSTDNSGSDTDNRTLVEHNLFEDNGINIYLYMVPYGSDGAQILSPTIRHNTIRNASYGLVVDETEPYGALTPIISHNVLYGFDSTGAYAISNLTSRPIDASENYWGDTESEWDAGAQAGDTNGNVVTSNHLVSSSEPVLSRVAPGAGQADDQVTLYGANFARISLEIAKTAPSVVAYGTPITYTLGVTNSGLTVVTNVLITDRIPVGATYVSGGSRVGEVVSWTLPLLAVGHSTQVTFVVTASATITNADYGVFADGGAAVEMQEPVVTVVKTPAFKLYVPTILRRRWDWWLP